MNENNAKFLVGTLKNGEQTVEVYLLNARDCFQGFGGSSQGLVVRKTASLIVRERGFMQTDTEYKVNDQKAWEWLFKVAANQPKS